VPTTTDRLGRTRVRISPGTGGGRCLVRCSIDGSDPTVPTVRPVVTRHDATRVQLSLVPEGALLLAGDAVELDLTVDAGATVEVLEPGGTVAYDMRGGRARWDVSVRVAAGAALTWAGQPFVVSQGADVDRRIRIRYAAGARLAVRETLVLGRSGERPGMVRQSASVRRGDRPVLVEELVLDAATAGSLVGPHRVVATVLAVGAGSGPPQDRFDLGVEDAVLWRRLGAQAHEAALPSAWEHARAAALQGGG
jgi:urease accessory protein